MEGLTPLGIAVVVAITLVVCVAQVLARVFTTIDPSAAF